MQGNSKQTPHLRNIFHVDENDLAWREALKAFPNHVPRFEDKASCVAFMKSQCLRESNPSEPGLKHSVTTLTDWEQIERYLLPKMLEYNRRFPVKPFNTDKFYRENKYFGSNPKAHPQPSSSSSDEVPFEGMNPEGAKKVADYVSSRLNLAVHHQMNYRSSVNTLQYLYHHMRCGIYVMVRSGQVVIFAPFVNKHYTNNWGAGFKIISEEEGSGSAPPTNSYERQAVVKRYYMDKEAQFGYQKDNYLPDTAQWWANGNIICNQHTTVEDQGKQEAEKKKREEKMDVDGVGGTGQEAVSQWWGDSFLLQIKDMIAETCRCREVSQSVCVLCCVVLCCAVLCWTSEGTCRVANDASNTQIALDQHGVSGRALRAKMVRGFVRTSEVKTTLFLHLI
jgi:hypothetical protein